MHPTLFIVATPIGNLGDLSARARTTLDEVSLIAAEDTRHSRKLLDHYQIQTPMRSLHEHNESQRVAELLTRMRAGESIALISDAGTPLVSDPGYKLVRAAAEAGFRVSPIPGPCAAIAALCVSGLAIDKFFFEGFLPARAQARQARLEALAKHNETLVFYVAPHRLREELRSMAAAFGGTRAAIVARELSKLHESIYRGDLESLQAASADDSNMGRGELVVVVAGAPAKSERDEDELLNMLSVLLPYLSVRNAGTVLAELTGCGRNKAYKLALQLAKDKNPEV